MKRIAVIILLLVALGLAGSASAQTSGAGNPTAKCTSALYNTYYVDTINNQSWVCNSSGWRSGVGFGAPSAESLACTSSNFGNGYVDLTNNNSWFCSTGGWTQSGSGAGLITGITAGTGLTGGGSSGNVTVALSVPVSETNGGTGANLSSATAGNAVVQGPSTVAVASPNIVDNAQASGTGVTLSGPFTCGTTVTGCAFQWEVSAVPTTSLALTGSSVLAFGFDTTANDSTNSLWRVTSLGKYQQYDSGNISGITNAVPQAALVNCAAHKFVGNNTGSTGANGCDSIGTGDLPTGIPIANVGTAGLSGTAPIAISAAGAIGCSTCNTSSATVSSIATTSPITGGTITTTGTIACATCVTSAASLTSGGVMIGQGSQASAVSPNVSIATGTLNVGTTGQTGTLNINGSTAGVAAPITTGASGLTLIFPTGTTTNPGFNFVSNNSNSGFIGNGAGGAEFVSSGTVTVLLGANGYATTNSLSYAFNRSGTRELGLDDESAATGGVVAGVGGSTNGNEGGLLRDANVCRITADVSLTVNTANSFCSFSVGGTARGWGFTCDILWAITAGTGTNNFALGVNASQTPTAATNANGTVYTTATGTETDTTTSISASGATNIATGATYTPAATVLKARITGTVLTSATAGTFAITATANGTTATAAVKAGTVCQLL